MLVIEVIVKKGYCCAFGYMLANRHKTTKEMAEELGLAPRTIRLYKQRLKERKLICYSFSNCYGDGSSKTFSKVED